MERSVLRLKHQCVLAYHSLFSKLLTTVFLWTSSDKQSNWASGNSMIYSLTSHQRFIHFYLFSFCNTYKSFVGIWCAFWFQGQDKEKGVHKCQHRGMFFIGGVHMISNIFVFLLLSSRFSLE
jgi:hypothetical protein